MMDAFLRTCPPLPLPREMAQWDAQALALGLRGCLLMENAARAALGVLRTHVPHLEGKHVWLFMGNGNNGGDAAALARCLHDARALPVVAHLKPLSAFRGAAAEHIRMARAAGVPFVSLTPALRRGDASQAPALLARLHRSLAQDDAVRCPDICVDGLLGTGFHGPLHPNLHHLIAVLHLLHARSFLLALDIPSGLDGVTGLPRPIAVQAHATATFAAAKPGIALPHARSWTGQLHICDIGMPRAIRENGPCSQRLLPPDAPARFAATIPLGYKNTYGHVAVIGGAGGLSGAAHLAALAALRSGAGLVTALVPASSAQAVKGGQAEIMTFALASTDAATPWKSAWTEEAAAFLHRCDALAIGPGMGRGDDALFILKEILKEKDRPPTVFDADALMLLARQPTLLPYLTSRDILTPHPGEAAALLGCTVKDVQAQRGQALASLTRKSDAAVVLKGSGSLAAQGDSPQLLCPVDVPQLSIGGSGDVLAGCAAALLARANTLGVSSLAVLGAALRLHAAAGQRCAVRFPCRGNSATELAEAIPQAWNAAPADPYLFDQDMACFI